MASVSLVYGAAYGVVKHRRIALVSEETRRSRVALAYRTFSRLPFLNHARPTRTLKMYMCTFAEENTDRRIAAKTYVLRPPGDVDR